MTDGEEQEGGGDETEYRESKYADLSIKKEYDEMTRAELRGAILRELGHNEKWFTPLTKAALNSLHAYLTGSFAVPKRAMKAQHNSQRDKSRAGVLLDVVVAAEVGEPEDRWSESTSGQPRHLRRAELQEIREAMDDTKDQRRTRRNDGKQ